MREGGNLLGVIGKALGFSPELAPVFERWATFHAPHAILFDETEL
jgi:hypothetical protein